MHLQAQEGLMSSATPPFQNSTYSHRPPLCVWV